MNKIHCLEFNIDLYNFNVDFLKFEYKDLQNVQFLSGRTEIVKKYSYMEEEEERKEITTTIG